MTTVEDHLDARPVAVARAWLDALATAAEAGIADGLDDLFVTDCWWRDLLSLTWDFRTFHGRTDVRGLVAGAGASLRGAVLRSGSPPSEIDTGDGLVVQAHFQFETEVARCRGLVSLVPADGENGAWQARTVFTFMSELIGHEEAVNHRRPWGRRTDDLDPRGHDEPDVIVVGAGHSGLNTAARLERLGVDTVIIERNARVGDSWRHRYPSLVLHDPVHYDHMPYLPFPSSWPLYASKDKIADWLELYVKALDLKVRTSTQIAGARYDTEEGRWEVRSRDASGSERVMRARHIVIATGTSGTEPYRPLLPGQERFAGPILHSSEFDGGARFAGQRVLVVGCGNSGHDIAQDLCSSGADVTMVQRSPVLVVDIHTVLNSMSGTYAEDGPPVDEMDVLAASVPIRALTSALQAATTGLADADAKLHEGLRAAGFQLGFGPDGTGLLMLFLTRGGGYYINVGCSQLIADGRIRVRSGVEIAGLDRTTVTFTDGTTLEADAVVLATGYLGMIETVRRMLGQEIADACRPVWGLEEDGEIRSLWRRSGQEGLWFSGGNFAYSRFYTRFLAMQIKAIEIGALRRAEPVRA